VEINFYFQLSNGAFIAVGSKTAVGSGGTILQSKNVQQVKQGFCHGATLWEGWTIGRDDISGGAKKKKEGGGGGKAF